MTRTRVQRQQKAQQQSKKQGGSGASHNHNHSRKEHSEAAKKKTVPQTSEADNLLHAQGQRGSDIRAPSRRVHTSVTLSESLVQPGSNLVLPVTCTYYDRAISYLSMGIVLKAMTRGYKWQDRTFASCPYYAFRYMITIFKNAMKGDIPQIQQAPRWFWNIIYALKAKTVSFKTAQIKYSWSEIQSGVQDSVNFSLGAGPDGNFSIFWGVGSPSTSTLINDIPTLVAPPPYDEQGPTALNALFSFYSSIGLGELMGDPGYSVFDRDTSAFASVFPEIGESFFSPGSLKNTVQSERNIDSPILSKFAVYQQGVFRGWQQEKVSGGSASYLGGRACEMTTLNEWRNKTPPIFKFFNFDEFYYTLSKTLALALENYSNFSGVNPSSVTPCPLNPLQVQLVLRQALLPYFSNELAQDLRLQGPDWTDIHPFVIGPNGIYAGRQAMMVPTMLAENIQCCRRITARLRGGSRQIIDVVPVLGRSSERRQLGNFTYGENGATVYSQTEPVFVNLIDLSATVDSQTYFLDLNTEAYTAMVNSWNEWIQKYSAALSGLVPLSGEGGAECLSTVVFTNIQRDVMSRDAPTPPTTASPAMTGKALEKKGSKKQLTLGCAIPRKNVGLGAAPVPGTSYLGTVADVRTSGVLGFSKELWPYLSIFILPCSWSPNGEGISASQAVQVFNCEASFIDRSSSNPFTAAGEFGACPTVEERLNQLAVCDVKFPTQDGDNSLVAGLKTLSAKGQGGFFTRIASIIGDAVGVPEIGAVANVVGKMTGL